jgi:hypothetical protein
MPKTLDAVEEIATDGSITFSVRSTFDADAWAIWKAQVGDQPARLRAMFQHQFAATVIEDFKLERDDLNRTASVSMRSPVGPVLRRDGTFFLPVEKEFRLVNHTGREWFFSGNNPHAGNSLNTIKLVLPVNIVEISLINPGTSEQGLVYSLAVSAGPSRALVWTGGVILALGAIGLLVGLIGKQPASAPLARTAPPAAPSA